MYVTRLRNSVNQMFQLSPDGGLNSFKDSLMKQVAFLQTIKPIIESELNNYVILENDTLTYSWTNLLRVVNSTLGTITTPPPAFAIPVVLQSEGGVSTIIDEKAEWKKLNWLTFTLTYETWFNALNLTLIQLHYKKIELHMKLEQ